MQALNRTFFTVQRQNLLPFSGVRAFSTPINNDNENEEKREEVESVEVNGDSTVSEWSDDDKPERGHYRSDKPQKGRDRPTHCFNCGEDGHISKDCPNERVDNRHQQDNRTCHNCGQEGHISRDCPEERRADNRACHRCGQPGHIVRDCPEPDDRPQRGGDRRAHREGYNRRDDGYSQPFDNRGERRDSYRDREPRVMTCFNCGQEGHHKNDCDQPRKERDMSEVKCFNCQQTGHMASDCPNEKVEREQRSREDFMSTATCYNCQQTGHMANECPNERVERQFSGDRGDRGYDRPSRGGYGDRGARGGRGGYGDRGARGGRGDRGGYQQRDNYQPRDNRSMTCYNCGQTGHMSRQCPEPRSEGQGNQRRSSGGRGPSRRNDSDDDY